MTRIKHILVLFVIVSLAATMPMGVVAGDAGDAGDDGGGDGNIICDTSGDTAETTALGGIVETVISLIVYLGALSAVVGGAAFTMASAAKPGDSKYIENRNQAIKYGAGSVLVLYLAEALVSELDESLSFSCVLPFAG